MCLQNIKRNSGSESTDRALGAVKTPVIPIWIWKRKNSSDFASPKLKSFTYEKLLQIEIAVQCFSFRPLRYSRQYMDRGRGNDRTRRRSKAVEEKRDEGSAVTNPCSTHGHHRGESEEDDEDDDEKMFAIVFQRLHFGLTGFPFFVVCLCYSHCEGFCGLSDLALVTKTLRRKPDLDLDHGSDGARWWTTTGDEKYPSFVNPPSSGKWRRWVAGVRGLTLGNPLLWLFTKMKRTFGFVFVW
ncbi:hypothetical protein U1Q18_009150 [Sarracenia purpurea var. burkii]